MQIIEMVSGNAYRIVKLANGSHSVHSLAHHETFHPVVGPVAEAESLYVRQLEIPRRVAESAGEFVIWDVGLGAAANTTTLLRATRQISSSLKIVSFDHTLEPLRFALQHVDTLPYLSGYEDFCQGILKNSHVKFTNGEQKVAWEMHLADFPSLLAGPGAAELPKPDAIMFDAFSPAKNPSMWTAPLFTRMYQLLNPGRPCALPTYSRSTMLRVTLLLAGFYVGIGHGIGDKEETTIAANSLNLIDDPLPVSWLNRARRSSSAEPLWDAHYRQAPLSTDSRDRLQRHPQFQ